MGAKINIKKVYVPSEEVVAREIQGEFIIIPITADAADSEEAIFTMNKTGKAIWDKLDGKNTLDNIAEKLRKEFKAKPEEIEKDVAGFTRELLKRKMIVNK